MKTELSVPNADSNTWEWRGGDFSLGDDANIGEACFFYVLYESHLKLFDVKFFLLLQSRHT